MTGPEPAPAERDAVEALIQREAALLDARRYEEWLALFAPDAWYWVPSRPGQPGPKDEVSIFYDDRMLMETRVRRLTAATAHAETPRTQTVRIVSRSQVRAAEGGFEAESKFALVEYRAGRQLVYAGTARHGIRASGAGLVIAWKRVDLVNADGVHESITVPF